MSFPLIKAAAASSLVHTRSDQCPHEHILSLIVLRSAHTLHKDRRTVTGTDALPGVMWGDVTGSGCSEMAQSVSCQLDGVPAASWRAAGAQTPVMAHPEDAEAQRVLDVRYNPYMKEFFFQTAHSKRPLHLTGLPDSLRVQTNGCQHFFKESYTIEEIPDMHCSVEQI